MFQLPYRLRRILPDLTTLILGTALLLVWAGIIEAFLSQYHAPVFPYSIKISFGVVQLVLLFVFLYGVGRRSEVEPRFVNLLQLPRHEIITDEGVAFDYEYAGQFRVCWPFLWIIL